MLFSSEDDRNAFYRAVSRYKTSSIISYLLSIIFDDEYYRLMHSDSGLKELLTDGDIGKRALSASDRRDPQSIKSIHNANLEVDTGYNFCYQSGKSPKKIICDEGSDVQEATYMTVRFSLLTPSFVREHLKK
jgi:hypothetical protein